MGSWWLRETRPKLAFIRYRFSCSLSNHTHTHTHTHTRARAHTQNVIRHDAFEYQLDMKNLAPNLKLDTLLLVLLQL
jgi:hypothetical protein